MNFFGPRRYSYRLLDWTIPENRYSPNVDKSQWNILLDTHFHTKYSDGTMSVEEGILWHLAVGFNAFFITDHETIAGHKEIAFLQEKYKDQILILPGLELANSMGHFNVLGLKTWDFEKMKGLKDEQYVKAIIEDAHKQGALVSINHFPWSIGGTKPRFSPKKHITREQALEWSIDLMEACNWDDDISPIDKESYNFCKSHPGIAPVCGTDVHSPDKDQLYGWTLLKTESFTMDAVMQALHQKKTEILFAQSPIPYPVKHHENLSYRLLKPLMQIGQMFIAYHKGGAISNLDWKGLLLWILYVLCGFGIIELILLL